MENKRRIKVFVSSTGEDLEKERSQVLEAIRYLEFEHVAMEYFGADPRQPIKVCLKKVDHSDIYVGIIGHKYGKIVESTGKSFTQMEYEEASRKNLPCLIYLRSDDFPIPAKYMEQDPELLKKLKKFKAYLKRQHTLGYFRDANDLSLKVVVDLSKQTKELDYEVLEKIILYVSQRLHQIQEDDDIKFHYLQKRLEKLGLVKYSGYICPVCGRLLEAGEPLGFGMKHPVCSDCLVNRTERVREQLTEDHPEMLTLIESRKKKAEEYLKAIGLF